jgi:hypothetical protein
MPKKFLVISPLLLPEIRKRSRGTIEEKTEAVYALIVGPRLLKHPAPQAFRKSPKI